MCRRAIPGTEAKLKRALRISLVLCVLCLALFGGALTPAHMTQDDLRDVRAKEVLKSRRPGKSAGPDSEDRYSAPKNFPTEAPRNRINITMGMTLWRVRPVTEKDEQSRLRREWMTWEQNDHEVVVTRISDKEPIPNQELVQMTIEYLPDVNGRAANRAGYLYVINREQFPDGSLRNARLIFPTLLTYEGDNRLLPGKTVTLPDPKRPFIISRAVSAETQTSEVYTIILAPISLNSELPQALRRTAMALPPQLVASWERRWAVHEVRADLKDGVGRVRTERERDSSGDVEETRSTKDSAEDLTQDDAAPQTVFRSIVRPGTGMLFTVRVPFQPLAKP